MGVMNLLKNSQDSDASKWIVKILVEARDDEGNIKRGVVDSDKVEVGVARDIIDKIDAMTYDLLPKYHRKK